MPYKKRARMAFPPHLQLPSILVSPCRRHSVLCRACCHNDITELSAWFPDAGDGYRCWFVYPTSSLQRSSCLLPSKSDVWMRAFDMILFPQLPSSRFSYSGLWENLIFRQYCAFHVCAAGCTCVHFGSDSGPALAFDTRKTVGASGTGLVGGVGDGHCNPYVLSPECFLRPNSTVALRCCAEHHCPPICNNIRTHPGGISREDSLQAVPGQLCLISCVSDKAGRRH